MTTLDLRAHSLNVLVADNQQEIIEQAEAELGAFSPPITLHPAGSIAEAIDILTSRHLDIAFVDLSFNSAVATAVIQELGVQAPSCEVVVMTKRLDLLQKSEGMRLIAPGNRLRGVANKSSAGRLFEEVCRDHVQRRKNLDLEVSGLTGRGGVLHAITTSSIGSQSLAGSTRPRLVGTGHLGNLRAAEAAVLDELVYLVRTVFGDAVSPFTGPVTTAASPPLLTLELLAGGRSDAVVAKGSLQHPDAKGERAEGVSCLLKFASREESIEEYDRYSRLVRFGLPSDLRVEVMSHAFGDTIGVICYSFAGETGGSIRTLNEWFASHDENEEIIDRLLGRLGAFGDDHRYPDRDLKEYFEHEFTWSGSEALEDIQEWLDQLVAARLLDNVTMGEDKHTGVRAYRAGRRVLHLPTSAFLADPAFRRRHGSRLQHGDLHGGNVVVLDDEGSFKLIDYRNAGLAPAFLDSISLQAWIRLSDVRAWGAGNTELPTRATVASMLNRYSGVEASIDARTGLLSGRGTLPGWARNANRATNSVISGASLDKMRSFLWTALIYSLYQASFESMGTIERLRQLTWTSALVDSIQSLRGARDEANS